VILLDPQSTVDLLCNRKLVSHVWETDQSMTVHGNGGDLTTNMKAHILNYGDVWFHPDAITNILCLKNVKKQFRVTYDSEGEGAFIVHKPNGVNVHFVAHANGLHYLDTNDRQFTMVSTVAQEPERFSKQQLELAKTARDFQSNVGHPSTQNLKSIVQNNLIVNCPVTAEDTPSPTNITAARTVGAICIDPTAIILESEIPGVSDFIDTTIALDYGLDHGLDEGRDIDPPLADEPEFPNVNPIEILEDFDPLQNSQRLVPSSRGKSYPSTAGLTPHFVHPDDHIVPASTLEEMVGDFFTKPLQSKLFYKFRKLIMNLQE
jgi:hypothetical protein